jgi:predicted ATP-dependent serine protease
VRKSTMMATPTEMPRIQQIQKLFIEGAQRLSKYHLNVIDNVTALEEIFADVRMAHSQKPVDAVFIDYIQLMTSSQRGFDREQQFLAYASKACKSLAGELGALVATPSQVNKDGVTRGAQDVEFYANAILGIQVDEEEHRLVTINKQRDGERGVALPLDWDGRITKFISSATAGS